MAVATKHTYQQFEQAPAADLSMFATLPDWLTAAIQPERVIAALASVVPEFASGGLTLRACKIKHMGLDDASGQWVGDYHLSIEGPQPGQKQTVLLRGALSAPGARDRTGQATPHAFGTAGWRCYLPALGLELHTFAAEPELPALPYLTDPEQARALLEQSIRAGTPAYRDLQIQACEPELMRSRAGVRHVLRYRLHYPPELAAQHSWPAMVVAKTYDGELGQNAYHAMRALWESPLGASTAVAIAEPLAYLPEPRVLVQGPIQEEQTLEELIESAMRANTPEAFAELESFLRKTAIGLAALHQSDVGYGRTFSWADRLAQARAALDGLAAPLPWLAEAAAPMIANLEAVAAEQPPDPAVSAHGAFRSAQVLIHQGTIGFIDFDGFCQAEPAMDLARFTATAKDIALDAVFGKQPGDDPDIEQRRLQTLMQIEALCETFLAQYELLAPVSRTRIALWEALNIFTLVMSCWKKIKPARLKNTMLMLQRQLSLSGIADGAAVLKAHVPEPSPAPTQAERTNGAARGLRKLATLPDWLLAPLQADRVGAALQHQVPEFASTALTLRSCKIKRMLLKGDSGRWVGTYNITTEGEDGKRSLALRGTFTPPRLRDTARSAAHNAPAPFGTEHWRLALPELGLELEPEPPEAELTAMPQLTDPEQAGKLLEQGLRAGDAIYRDLRIQACRPEIISYKPGSRATIRYYLSYAAGQAGAERWPAEVIAKTYRKDSKGQNAYDGMTALWHSPLPTTAGVTIAEPLAYIPELKIMVQRPIPSDQSLEDMLKSALAADSQAAMDELYDYMRRAAAGLAAFHQSGVRHGAPVALAERFAEIRDLITRLTIPVPELAGTVEPLLARLEALAVATPPDPAVPTHGTFNPEQVLIHGQSIGLIDFDDFGMAEPAMDVGLFRAAIKDIGMNALDASAARTRESQIARLARLDAIGEVFLSEYARLAPISRARVALWEAWSYLRDTLHYWTKVKPAEPDHAMLMLESHLHDMIAVEPAAQNVSISRRNGNRASTPIYRYVALAGVLAASDLIEQIADLLGSVQSLL